LVPVEIHSDEDQAVNLFPVQRDPVAHNFFFLFRVTFSPAREKDSLKTELNGPAEG